MRLTGLLLLLSLLRCSLPYCCLLCGPLQECGLRCCLQLCLNHRQQLSGKLLLRLP